MNRVRLLICVPLLCLWACGPDTAPVQTPPHPVDESPQTTPPEDETPRPNPRPEPQPQPQPEPQPQPQPEPQPEPPPPPPPPVPETQLPFKLPAPQTSVQEYELLIPAETMKKFAADPLTPEQDAVFKANGTTYAVKVRLRGASARYFPKKSWNVSFADKVRFEGRTSLNLVAEYADATMLSEVRPSKRTPSSKLTFQLFFGKERAEAPRSRTFTR